MRKILVNFQFYVKVPVKSLQDWYYLNKSFGWKKDTRTEQYFNFYMNFFFLMEVGLLKFLSSKYSMNVIHFTRLVWIFFTLIQYFIR